MAPVWRGTVVALAVISWLTLSNHCALGLATGDPHSGIGVPKHDCCASDVPTHQNRGEQSGNPCCKTLPVVSISVAKAFVGPGHGLVVKPVVPAIMLDLADTIELTARFLDTGPPEKTAFAETVLQQSLQAHAPPCLS